MNFNQQPHALMMIRPSAFGFNVKTAASNVFQQVAAMQPHELQYKALEEFDRMVDILRSNEIDVHVFEDTRDTEKPDAVFPNNWISFHQDGTVVLYPMLAENRRKERRTDIVEALKKDFMISNLIDLTEEENQGKYLEGTGSIVFDHVYRLAYACRSPRTDDELVNRLADTLNYQPIIFNATDEKNFPIYHTNVVMAVGERFAVVCLDAIKREEDQEVILEKFAAANKKVVAISYAQMRAFAGNLIEVRSRHGERFVLLSQTAFDTFLPGQLDAISQYAEVLPLRIETIEKAGGGSVRCMVAGIHLPERNH